MSLLTQHAHQLLPGLLAWLLVATFPGCSRTSDRGSSSPEGSELEHPGGAATVETPGDGEHAAIDTPVPAPTGNDGAVAETPPAPQVAIVDRPIIFDGERERLTIEYRRAHQDPEASDINITPRMIILHYTGGGSADSTIRYFNRPTMEGERKKLAQAAALNVSAHFLVDRDGTIYRLMPETVMARHCIGFNHVAIGVENVGDEVKHPLTEAQVEANQRLIRYLVGVHPITHLIGHHEYRDMDSHEYFLELDPAYRNRKGDPGPGFMARVRAGLSDLDLRGPDSR